MEASAMAGDTGTERYGSARLIEPKSKETRPCQNASRVKFLRRSSSGDQRCCPGGQLYLRVSTAEHANENNSLPMQPKNSLTTVNGTASACLLRLRMLVRLLALMTEPEVSEPIGHTDTLRNHPVRPIHRIDTRLSILSV